MDEHGEDLVVLGVNPGGLFGGETEETMSTFIDQTGITFSIVWDAGTYGAWSWPPSISPFPRQAVLGRDGRVRYMASEHDLEGLRAAVAAAVSE